MNEEFSWWNVGLNECGGDFLREVKKLLEFAKAVEAIVDGNVDGSKLFHGIVADSEELKHDVHLLNSDVAVVVEVKKTDGDNDNDGQDEESDVVKSRVVVEQMVIVVLLNEEVVVLFHDQVLVMNNFGLLDPPEQLVIHLGPLVNQF